MDEMHLALHGLAIKKHAGPAAIAGLVGLDLDKLTELLARATATGRSVEVQGGYMLTPAGRMILDGQYSRIYGAVRADVAFVAVYKRFERVNTELKQLITDWQMLEFGGKRVRNDHSNKDYDARVLDRLGALHERYAPILKELVARVPRLAVYGTKLQHALEQAENGAVQWVADVKIESYHTVWFEMHEDLLRILGRQRDE